MDRGLVALALRVTLVLLRDALDAQELVQGQEPQVTQVRDAACVLARALNPEIPPPPGYVAG